MNKNNRPRFQRFFKWGIGIFALFFVMRLIYGYFDSGVSQQSDMQGDFFSSINNLRRNYASEKMSSKSMNLQEPPSQTPNFDSNQKYEKTANIKSKSSNFERDKGTLAQKTKAFEAVIQYEKNEGNKGNRELHLLIGVKPALFDSFYTEMQKIGTLRATESTKIDKTNEFRQLNAQKVSLGKTLASLNELKNRGGAISDFVGLHDKILEIEQKLQDLGVELGNFDSENEFCSVRFSLYEGITTVKISFLHRVKVALEWSIRYYALTAFGLTLMAVFAFILILILEKLKVLVVKDL